MSVSKRQRDKMEREAADMSTSGIIPIFGLTVLAFVVAAFFARLIL